MNSNELNTKTSEKGAFQVMCIPCQAVTDVSKVVKAALSGAERQLALAQTEF